MMLTTAQADEVRRALRAAERRSGLRFGLFVCARNGLPAAGRRHFAERLHAAYGTESPDAVLVLVDLDARALEIVTGENARGRLTDGTCRATARAMATAFSGGDLAGGLVYGFATLGQQAAARR
ncbi:DUF5130 family protein [Nonomuraea longicatena]